MLNIKPQHWLALSLLGVIGITAWMSLAFPRYQNFDLSITRNQAIDIAHNYLKQTIGADPQGYKRATVFSMDGKVDRYLQKTLGDQETKRFIERYSYDLFYWYVRFFKENQKEEYKVVISSRTGKVIRFLHYIDETASRPSVTVDEARQAAIAFINQSTGLSENSYTLHSQNIEKRENRIDHFFVWEKNDIEIPWDARYGGGKAKLLIAVQISGHDVLHFDSGQLDIPDAFARYIDNLNQTGNNLKMFFGTLYLGLLTCAIMLLVNRRRYIVPKIVWPFYLAVGGVLFIGIVLDLFNSYQDLLFDYSSTQAFGEYLLKTIASLCMGAFYAVPIFILPGLSGEALRYEIAPQRKEGGFLHNFRSSFFTREVASQIWVGYLITPVILAIQALILLGGYKYFGVWDELSWLVQSGTNFIPAFSVFVLGLQSSITEEIMFRLFAINLFKRYGIKTFWAVLLSAAAWGFGHTGYAVFPMWFRGLEMTCIGIILGFVYLRFGLMTIIVTHFLINTFYHSIQYLINPQATFDFLTCLFVILLPLLFSVLAFKMNRSTVERPWRPQFNPQQEFNYQLLKTAYSLKKPEQLENFKRELMQHGWDPVIIERVFQEGDFK